MADADSLQVTALNIWLVCLVIAWYWWGFVSVG